MSLLEVCFFFFIIFTLLNGYYQLNYVSPLTLAQTQVETHLSAFLPCNNMAGVSTLGIFYKWHAAHMIDDE